MKTPFHYWLVLSAFALSACSVKPVVISEQEHRERVSADGQQLYQDQEPITSSVSLHEAMARAIRYNLDHRLKVMEEALASDMLDVSRLDMLPSLVANAGYRGRNNDAGSSSRSLITGNESLEISTSQERERRVADLGLSWNILDFGVSYYRAKQQADRLMIVAERRRKVIHNIIGEVRDSYWRAWAAQNVLNDVAPLMERMQKALLSSQQVEKRGLKTPLESLQYQQRLLSSMRQLNEVRRNLVTAKTELATLMSLPLSTDFTLQQPEETMPEIPLSMEQLEDMALLQRPELREEGYHDRISAAEIKRTMVSLMPSLTLSTTYNYDSNDYNKHASWLDFSAMISGNLLDIATINQRLDIARSQAEVVDTRRLALNMAVLSQVHIAVQDFSETVAMYQTDKAIFDVENRILNYVSATADSESGHELDVVERELNAVFAELQMGESYALLQSAYGRVYLTIGADPLTGSVADYSIDTLAAALASGEKAWNDIGKQAQ